MYKIVGYVFGLGLVLFFGWQVNELYEQNKRLKRELKQSEDMIKAVSEYIVEQNSLQKDTKKQRRRLKHAFKKNPTVRFNDLFPPGM